MVYQRSHCKIVYLFTLSLYSCRHLGTSVVEVNAQLMAIRHHFGSFPMNLAWLRCIDPLTSARARVKWLTMIVVYEMLDSAFGLSMNQTSKWATMLQIKLSQIEKMQCGRRWRIRQTYGFAWTIKCSTARKGRPLCYVNWWNALRYDGLLPFTYILPHN